MNASSLKLLQHRPMVYVGDIGSLVSYKEFVIPRQNKKIDVLLHDTAADTPIYKYGITSNIHRRICREHAKNFTRFDLKLLKEAYRNKYVETLVTQELKQRNMLLELYSPHRKRLVRELFCFTDPTSQVDWFLDFMEDTIHKSRIIDDEIMDWNVLSRPECLVK